MTTPFSEHDLLAHIAASAATQPSPHVLVGPGDDCAVLDRALLAPGEHLLLKVDQVIEGRHFTSTTPLAAIAHKAIARVLSDLAAMAGQPRALLAACVLPREWSHERAQHLADALHERARHWNAPCVGGDLARHGQQNQPLILSISALGVVQGTGILRGGARPGHDVYCTGSIGGSFPSGKHLAFEPRLREAALLREALGPRLHAMCDISDGLGIDAATLATASNARIELFAAAIPRSPHAHDVTSACADGEDYELLLTATGDVPPSLAGTPLTRIGRVLHAMPDHPACVLLRDGHPPLDLSRAGFDHGTT